MFEVMLNNLDGILLKVAGCSNEVGDLAKTLVLWK
tara:strand:+ start:969 stop:1073 length:105 start_codon:yes stop_codon:yes gene_type:complete